MGNHPKVALRCQSEGSCRLKDVTVWRQWRRGHGSWNRPRSV